MLTNTALLFHTLADLVALLTQPVTGVLFCECRLKNSFAILVLTYSYSSYSKEKIVSVLIKEVNMLRALTFDNTVDDYRLCVPIVRVF
jgi:hypothetical protein